MNYRRPELLDALAGQFALGTLRGPARRRFAKLALADAHIATAVRAWEERLLPFAGAIAPVEPPPRVWEAVRGRIERRSSHARAAPTLWDRLGFWRGLAVASLVGAFALALALFSGREETAASYVAVLAGSDAKPALLVSGQRGARVLTVKAVAVPPIAADRSLELWALPPAGNPRALGLVSASGVLRLTVPADEAERLEATPALAVSLEPQGGSPTGLPTGPVLYSGALQRFY